MCVARLSVGVRYWNHRQKLDNDPVYRALRYGHPKCADDVPRPSVCPLKYQST